MLKGIHPLLRGELLMHVDRLGHGDTCLIADANFPAHRLSESVIEIPSADSPDVLHALLTVFPLDTYEGPALILMSSEGDTVAGPQAADPMREAFGDVAPNEPVATLARKDFYDSAATARFIIRTGELRPYGNVILRKGVVGG